MEYNMYRQKLDKVIDRHKEILYTKENGEPYHWLDKDKILKDKAFSMIEDILEAFKDNNPELFHSISDNFYQENCIFINIVDEDIGNLCNFWGYGIDQRLGKCRRYFIFSDCVNHWTKSQVLKMQYQEVSIKDLKAIVDKLEKENILTTKDGKRNIEYEIIMDSVGYDEGVIRDLDRSSENPMGFSP